MSHGVEPVPLSVEGSVALCVALGSVLGVVRRHCGRRPLTSSVTTQGHEP